MRLPISATLIERVSSKEISAEIHLATERDLFGWTNWAYSRHDADRDWNWWSNFQESNKPSGNVECYALVTGLALQGLMLLNLTGRGTGKTKALVVDFLSTNPANRHSKSGFKRVGLALIGVAILRSLDCRMGGRIWLESLPDAEAFYESLGFVARTSQSSDGLTIFTLSESAAAELLEELKRKEIIEP